MNNPSAANPPRLMATPDQAGDLIRELLAEEEPCASEEARAWERLEERLDALRRDVIGADACVTGPFGSRRICYADHIASGRPLGSVEDAVRDLVLPAYATPTPKTVSPARGRPASRTTPAPT